MTKFIFITFFKVLFSFFLIKLLIFSYNEQLVNPSQLVKSETIDALPFEVINQITPSLGNDKVIVLNIWESWCKPCIREIPELNDLMDNFKGSNIRFIALSSSSKQACNEALIKNNIEFKYESLFNRKSLIRQIDSFYFNKAMNMTVVPKNIIIDTDRKIVLFLVGSDPANILKMKLSLEEIIKVPVR